jgi:hypothetical protein
MIAAALLIWLATSRATPPLPHADWGACPFECCKYGEWTALSEMPIYASRDAKKPPIATLRKGEKVFVKTGVVITTKAGEVELLEEKTIGNGPRGRVTVPKGGRIYPLHYLGEGFELFWYQGRPYADFIGASEPGQVYSGFRVIDRWEDEWWLSVSTRDGRKGWVLRNRAAKFDAPRSCG